MYRFGVQKVYRVLLIALISVCLLFSVGIAEEGAVVKVEINGKVTDKASGESLAGASVQIKGKFVGTAANSDGSFLLKTSQPLPFTLVVSMIGYATQEIDVTDASMTFDVALEEKAFMVGDIVISASRVEENILTAPVTVEKMDQLQIRESPSVTFFDGLANMKEIEMTANSMVFVGPTGRGEGSSHNSGLIQLVDGVDNTGIANGGFAVGNMAGLSDIDIEEVEFLPGASSALYGPNAFSGVLFINSKSPFDYPGISFQVKAGQSNSDYAGSNPLYEASFRYAKAYGKLGYKFVVSQFQATDWYAHDFSGRQVSGSPYRGDAGTPGYDGTNVYGDEIATTLNFDALAGLPTGTLGAAYVARTGYKEEDLYDYNPAKSLKFSGSLRYRLNETMEASLDARHGRGRAIYQGTNRYALNDLSQTFTKLELKGQNFFVRGYAQRENAGDSYDIIFSGWNVNRSWKSDQQWFADYATTYIGAALPTAYGGLGLTPTEAHAAARSAADVGRLLPGTSAFDNTLDEVIQRKDFVTGAGFTSNSGFNTVEGMYNFADKISFVNLQLGGNFRSYGVDTEGTIYSDKDEGIDITEYGVYAQASKDVLDEKLKVTGSLRLDGHKNFDDHISPRVAAVFSPNGDHHFRASYQSGFNNPIIESQYINLDLGPITLIGGTQDNMDRTSRTPGNGDVYASAIDLGSYLAGTPKVVKTDFIKPEYQTSVEVGYKTLINNHLYVDLNYYHSNYKDRFTNPRVLDPMTGKVYGLYSNDDRDVVIRGAGAGLTYSFDNGYRVSTTYNYIERTGGSEDWLSSINRPKNAVKLSLGNSRLIKNLGFNLAARWRDEFLWAATFGEGTVGGEFVMDGQISYRLPDMNSTIKAGVNNMFSDNYRQMYGSVEIGRIFYVQLSYDSLF
ncbi:TonB-dependent receptor [candidate division KSB1 bacterium]|nr:TonB-dependent receptor [candidate division KSB1 bacterium]